MHVHMYICVPVDSEDNPRCHPQECCLPLLRKGFLLGWSSPIRLNWLASLGFLGLSDFQDWDP